MKAIRPLSWTHSTAPDRSSVSVHPRHTRNLRNPPGLPYTVYGMLKSSIAAALLMTSSFAQQTPPTAPVSPNWYNLSKFSVEGKGWSKTKNLYDRLPAASEGVVREPVWNLGQDSAGLRYRFITDADSIHARWKLRKPRLAMPHMAATGVSGVDLYVRDGSKWHWLAVGRPEK